MAYSEPVHDLPLSPNSENSANSSSTPNETSEQTITPVVPSVPKLVLMLNGEILSPSMTVFQALQNSGRKVSETSEENSAPQPIYRFWDQIYNLTYKVVDQLPAETSQSRPSKGI